MCIRIAALGALVVFAANQFLIKSFYSFLFYLTASRTGQTTKHIHVPAQRKGVSKIEHAKMGRRLLFERWCLNIWFKLEDTCAGSLWRYKSLLNSSTATSAPRSNWKQEFIEPYWMGDRAVLYHPTPHNKCHKHDNLTTEILWGWEASGISWSVAFSIIHLELAYTSLRFKKQLTISCESMYNCTYMQVRQCYS